MAYYVVNKTKIKSNIEKLKKSFLNKKLDFELFYSVKTNFMNPILSAVKEMGCEFEILSSFEWRKVRELNPRAVVLNGPAKEIKLVKEILSKTNILYFNIDNDTDIEILQNINRELLRKIKIGIRVYLNLSEVWNRFGYDISSKDFAKIVAKISSIKKISGFHFHFSTNNFKISNYQKMFSEIKNFCNRSKVCLEFLNIGGGLPAANEFVYESEVYEKLPTLISEIFPNLKIISEAGRNIVADAVSLDTNIISLKKTGKNKFQVNIDANIMHFPCYYEKKYYIEFIPINKTKRKEIVEIEIFGNSCMQTDKISDSIIIDQVPRVGDKIIIHNIGAYSYSQAANFITEIPQVKTYE